MLLLAGYAVCLFMQRYSGDREKGYTTGEKMDRYHIFEQVCTHVLAVYRILTVLVDIAYFTSSRLAKLYDTRLTKNHAPPQENKKAE